METSFKYDFHIGDNWYYLEELDGLITIKQLRKLEIGHLLEEFNSDKYLACVVKYCKDGCKIALFDFGG